MARAVTVRALLLRLHAAGGLPLAEDPPASGVLRWKTRLGRWPFEAQVDRFATELRCYLADELFCTGRMYDTECDALARPTHGAGAAPILAELSAYVDAEVRKDSRRFLKPPHADRHPDRRADARQDATIRQKPARRMNEPA